VRKTFLILLVSASAAVAQALQWEQPQITIDTVDGGEPVTVEFRFKNISDKTVTVRQGASSCSCVATAPPKTEFAPGESGVIPFKYKPGRRIGQRAYKIYISTDEKGAPPYRLVLVVNESAKPAPTE
jgi:hypothetical protein